MSTNWYVYHDGTPVEAEDDQNYDEAFGPRDHHTHEGRLTGDDDNDVVARVADGDTEDLSAEEAAMHEVESVW